jgi:sugar phosphate isomerase/epimerase
MLSISTSWNAIRHQNGASMVAEIKQLGFESVEVNYQVSSSQLEDINKSVARGEIRVSSLHNIVPLPQGADANTAHRLYPFTSPDSEARRRAVELAKETIDRAVELKAKAIVLHLGESWDAPLAEMERLYLNARLKGHQNKGKIEEMRQKLVSLRREHSGMAIERISECLREIVPYAKDQGVRLGFENRYWYTQFPNADEMEVLLQEFKTPETGLWFDVGHAATQEYLGFQQKNEILSRFGERMVGIHLMDCIRNSDHLPPGKGNYDFAALAAYQKPDIPRVLEMALFVQADDIRSGVAVLQKQGIG